MLRRLLPILLLSLVVGLPGEVSAKKRKKAETALAAGGDAVPELKAVLEQAGWLMTPEWTDQYQPGHVYYGNNELWAQGSHCFETTALESAYSSMEVRRSLEAGVAMDAVVHGARAGLAVSKKIIFDTPNLREIPGRGLYLTEGCLADLKKARDRGEDLSTFYVVTSVLSARIQKQQCGSYDAKAKVFRVSAEVEVTNSCGVESDVPVAIAYKTRSVAEIDRELGVKVVAAPVPPVAPPPQTPPARAPARASRPIPSAEASVPTPPAGRSSDGFTNSIGMKFVAIPAGSFVMGCTAEQGSDCYSDEKPAHNVTLSRSFYMQTTEVTQGQWRAVMGSNPSSFSSCGDTCPVETVSWNDAVAFAQKLSAKEGLRGGSVYRLPTEAEWEYAARAGQGTKYAGSNSLDAVAWHRGNSGSKTHPVGQKSPNAWGLYDMSGNVWEWTADWYGGYSSGNTTNPEGALSGSYRVIRGGCWGYAAANARVAFRTYDLPVNRGNDLGFRLVRTIP